jgi:hypothetical protein
LYLLFTHFVTYPTNFYLGGHESLNNASMIFCAHQMNANNKFASVAGFTKSSTWSSESMVTPSISGGDSRQEADYISVTADNTGTKIFNTTCQFCSCVSTKAANSFDGIVDIQLYATCIYFIPGEKNYLHGKV